MSDDDFDDDVVILEKYQLFSSEVLRLALLGLSAIGLVVSIASKVDRSTPPLLDLRAPGVYLLIVSGSIALSLAAGFALVHRYYSTESMSRHLHLRRMSAAKDAAKDAEKWAEKYASELAGRKRDFERSTWSIILAPVALFVGAFALVLAFSLALARPGRAAEKVKACLCQS